MFTLSAPATRRTTSHLLALAMIASIAACDSTDSTSPELVASRIVAIAGVDSQSTVVGKATNNSISVIVNAQNGAAVAGVPVTWTVVNGNGTVSSATTDTDTEGVATVSWTLGTVAGVNTLSASIAGGESVNITATGVAGAPAALNIMSGNNQAVAEDGTSDAFVVAAVDQYGNPISGLNIKWTSSAGTLNTTTTSTDASGQASTELTTDDTTQSYVVTASVGTLSASFTVTAQ